MARRRRRKKYYYANSRSRKYDQSYEPMELNLSPETKRGIAIIVFLLIAIISGLGILGVAGGFGELISKLVFLVFGQVGYVAPLVFLAVALSLLLGGRLVRPEKGEPAVVARQSSTLRTYIGMGLFTLAITGILHLIAINRGDATAFDLVKEGEGGGYLGIFTSFPLYSLMGYGASLAVLIALTLIAFLIAYNLSLHGIFRAVAAIFRFGSKKPASEQPSVKTAEVNQSQEPVKINTMENTGFAVGTLDPNKKTVEEEPEEFEEPQDAETYSEVPPKAPTEAAGAGVVLHSTPDHLRKGVWKLPSTDLLEQTDTKVDGGNIETIVKNIKKTLEDFGINVDMGEVNVGPTVTQYTFRPAVGVKLSQITALHHDLALALAAPSLRIEAPIPGKSLVGIEVPNKSSALVRLKDLIMSETFSKHESNLVFALGRDVAGHPMVADLAKMPHLLVAGATGTGKSVCINTILTSFLYRNSPEELRIIMIDPKRVELTLYNGIPHLLTPVIVDHKQAVNALRWMVGEMDNRYKMLAEAGKRNIEEYNKNGREPMPYIVLFVDELADLMVVAKNEVESSIVRLAQMARAVGLHLVLATQYPKAEIITGLIKANITSKVAFKVGSQVNSRVILDSSGAENLLGNGDMLYTTATLTSPKRIQGPFITEQEVRRVVGFIKDQSGPVDYQEEILESARASGGYVGGSSDDEADDEMINAAIEEIKRAGKASASLLQRRLKVGYARAARLLDILEERGLIGPAEGAKPREIYMDE